ncbi:response regulator transcription factor [Saccharibacillus sacchari]|uniref:Response regulator with CheY-like receiver domain and winged-helix DNA-binding domain n=1 Tax=Saccharibacillus sacchari DSM 19268 TaxID=915437 RepID=A0A010Z7S4_9BACL|nr:response regulator transcription factor [Saccharibacillus sacchari]EXG83313.1 response regulator with CheY-like receiver domain and winged-helix DNA-binding domain [Saccharibacillus sacchari DSM 19268]
MQKDGQNQQILIVEDDESINSIIRDGLTRVGFLCTSAYSGTEGLMRLDQQSYRLIVLDLMLPGLSGEAFMRQIRSEAGLAVPVIVLTAKDHLDHKLNLFALGADDYVTKPFELEELIARIRVHIGKSASSADPAPQAYRHKNLTLDCGAYSACINGTPLALTRQEYKILELLVKHPTRVFTKQDLYELAWDDVYLGEDKTITVHISNIRNKIKTYDPEPYIDTLWGIGFRLSG